MKHATCLAALLFAAGPVRAETCPELDRELLLHSCHGAFTAEALLLPEDRAAVAEERGPRLVVTGAYTSAETRGEGAPLPVGLFVRGGTVVNRQFAPMDGILLIDAAGEVSLHHRARVALGGVLFDLHDAEARASFLAAAEAGGLTVLQSHLLVVDGAVDVRPDDEAPQFKRRLVFVDGEGRAGVWQTSDSVTLFEAAVAVRAGMGAVMALNLDMGSYDLCVRQDPSETILEGENCGLIGWADAAKLSNLLAFRPAD